MRQSGFGSGSGMIVLDNLDCMGSESSLFDCPSDSPVLINDCDHSEDAGVRCLCEIRIYLIKILIVNFILEMIYFY